MTTHACPACHRELDLALAICPDCGSPLWALATVAMPVVAEPPVPVTHPQQSGAGWPAASATLPVDVPVAWTCPVCARQVVGAQCDFDGTRSPAARQPPPVPGAAPAGAPVLEVLLPDGTTLSLGSGEALDIGRHSPNARVAAALATYDGVGRMHATLSVSGNRVTVIDHHSTNGTRVNGTPVQGSISLPLDQITTIQLGRYVVLHLSRPSTAPTR